MGYWKENKKHGEALLLSEKGYLIKEENYINACSLVTGSNANLS